MRKLQLDIDTLRVDTFETGAEKDESGTVRGHWSQPGTCDAAFVATCQYGGSCGPGCATRSGCTSLDCV